MKTGQQTIDLLRNRMNGDDLREMTPEQLRQFEALCYHWQQMAHGESVRRNSRANTISSVFA